jgi:hypothetical protein
VGRLHHTFAGHARRSLQLAAGQVNELPEEPYPEQIWNEKVDAVWQFVYRRYSGGAYAGLH